MISSLRKRLNYSNVIASMALFVALGGVAVAAGLPKNSVGPKQLKRGAVKSKALARNAVTYGKIARGAVGPGKIGANAVGPSNIGNGAITSAKIGAGAVIAASIKNGVVTTNKLQNNAVTNAKLGPNAVNTGNINNGAVTPAKLSNEFGPLLGSLKSGQTLRGVFDVGGSGAAADPGAGEEAISFRDSQSFQFPLPSSPAANVLPAGTTSAACPGLGSGNTTPQAAAGQLCVYITTASPEAELTIDAGTANRLGFGLLAKFKKAKDDNFVQGVWAVTAP
jgi:hypothetical protein